MRDVGKHNPSCPTRCMIREFFLSSDNITGIVPEEFVAKLLIGPELDLRYFLLQDELSSSKMRVRPLETPEFRLVFWCRARIEVTLVIGTLA
jgi:hypothetical protein